MKTFIECLNMFSVTVQEQIRDNVVNQGFVIDDNDEYCDEVEFLHCVFDWSDTPQGYQYWETIADKL